jgi:hypothetical protein
LVVRGGAVQQWQASFSGCPDGIYVEGNGAGQIAIGI